MVPAWLTGIVALVQLVPSFISLLEQVLAAVGSHPAGAAAGVEAVKAHMAAMSKPDSSVVGVAPELK